MCNLGVHVGVDDRLACLHLVPGCYLHRLGQVQGVPVQRTVHSVAGVGPQGADVGADVKLPV